MTARFTSLQTGEGTPLFLCSPIPLCMRKNVMIAFFLLLVRARRTCIPLVQEFPRNGVAEQYYAGKRFVLCAVHLN